MEQTELILMFVEAAVDDGCFVIGSVILLEAAIRRCVDCGLKGMHMIRNSLNQAEMVLKG